MTSESARGAKRTKNTVLVVVPCFNEAKRLDVEAFRAAAAIMPDTGFLFVDDGSSDATGEILTKLCESEPDRYKLLSLGSNHGKAEAVRQGVLRAAGDDPDFIAYWDADLATPLDELTRMREVFDDRPETEIVLGSRVNLLGRHVRRRLIRHYVGRAFATMVAFAMRLPVYDTQCGAKLFRCDEQMLEHFREPFLTEWIFDAELLARVMDARGGSSADEMCRIAFELPLLRWEDVDGSSLRSRHVLPSLRDSVRIFARHHAIVRWHRGTRGLTKPLAEWTRARLRRLSTHGAHVGPLERVLRGLVLVPIFGVLLVWTRLRAWILGPIEIPAKTTWGTTFSCRLPDFIEMYLYLFGVWEPDVTELVRRRLRPGDTFIDVGANVGYHTLLASNVVGGLGHVAAIEAAPEIHARLLRELAQNRAGSEVRVVQGAVADRRGRLQLYRGPDRNTGLTTTVATRGFRSSFVVDCAPLDELLTNQEITTARLVKIDVEGGEDAVLRGMQPFLDRAPNDVEIVVELSPRWWSDRSQTPAGVLKPLVDRGFNVYRIDNNLWPWRYLWPEAVRRPRRAHRALSRHAKRYDLVLSRVDAEVL